VCEGDQKCENVNNLQHDDEGNENGWEVKEKWFKF